jgi:outer membrane protein OmpA-like peptidoglycan-associated protein
MIRLAFLSLIVLTTPAMANICGTDFQNFNPTTSGLDFVTVHSSETLKPCIINLGAFVNFAANSLTYSNLAATATKPKDEIVGMDLGMGIGLGKDWDVGINVPAVLSQKIDDTTFATRYSKTGITEVKLNTKYRLSGGDAGGTAVVLSVNQNLIENNAFVGEGAGPTWNFELAGDKAFGNWATALNIGYRKRNPGRQITGQPFVPLQDQYIYSIAGSYLFDTWKTKLILEVFGASAAKEADYSSDHSLNSLEALLGVKVDLNHSVAWHIGGSAKLGESFGGPEWRLYTGLNWAIGPICDPSTNAKATVEVQPSEPINQRASVDIKPGKKKAEIYRLNVSVPFATGSFVLEDKNISKLDTFIRSLIKLGFERMEVDGHTDSLEGGKGKIKLSQRRADSVMEYLIRVYKIDRKKISARGFGDKEPIANNGNYQGRQRNRRVEFLIWR